MHGPEKSDLPIVARKPANKAAPAAAEPMERRGGIEEGGTAKHGPDPEPGSRVPGAGPPTAGSREEQEGEAHGAAAPCQPRHSALGLLRAEEGCSAGGRPPDLGRVRGRPGDPARRSPRPCSSRRLSGAAVAAAVHTKAGRRPLGIAALEDKIVQTAVVAILTPIYEAEFLGFSYGFRPGRGQHDALDALAAGIARKRISWILGADLRSF